VAMSILTVLLMSKKFLARKGQKTLRTQPSKTGLGAKFRYLLSTLTHWGTQRAVPRPLCYHSIQKYSLFLKENTREGASK
jgi:hypothetical protein